MLGVSKSRPSPATVGIRLKWKSIQVMPVVLFTVMSKEEYSVVPPEGVTVNTASIGAIAVKVSVRKMRLGFPGNASAELSLLARTVTAPPAPLPPGPPTTATMPRTPAHAIPMPETR
jgi:hypothetical protein